MAKKQYVANEVNAEKVSETPTILVEAAKKENELSPNPAGSGFVKQHFVDSLPVSGNANELYIIPQKANGGIVGYKNYKYDVATKKWERVFGSDPLLKLAQGGQGTLAHNNNPERKAFAQIFNGNVAINGGKLYIDGKEAGAETPEEEKDLEDLKLINFKAPENYVWTTVTTTSFDTLKQYEGQFIALRPNTTSNAVRCYVKECSSVGNPATLRIVLVGVDKDSGKFYNEVAQASITYNASNWAPVKVIANPTLGEHDNLVLNALQVGGNKYAISSGTKLYKHVLSDSNYDITFITNNSNTRDWTQDTAQEIYVRLVTTSITPPTIDGHVLYYNEADNLLSFLLISDTRAVEYGDADDFNIENIVETVTPL